MLNKKMKPLPDTLVCLPKKPKNSSFGKVTEGEGINLFFFVTLLFIHSSKHKTEDQE